MFENYTLFNLENRLVAYKSVAKRIFDYVKLSGLILLLIGVVMFFVDYSFMTFFIFLGLYMFLVGIFSDYLSKKKIKKHHTTSMFKDDNAVTKYTFNEENMSQEVTINSENTSFTKVKYTDIVKVLEIADYFLIFIDQNHCFVVKKDGMTMGTADNLAEFLKSKVEKYKLRVEKTRGNK